MAVCKKWLPLICLFSNIKPSVLFPQPLYLMSLPSAISMADLLPDKYPFTSPFAYTLMRVGYAGYSTSELLTLCSRAGMHKTVRSS